MAFIDTPDFDEKALAKEQDGARPRFFMEPVQNNFRTEQEGRPCFDDVEMVEILVPGDRKTEWFGRVTQVHKERWPRYYAAFKENMDAPSDGTPLEQLPGVTRSQVEELRFMKVRTIEALAGLPDDLLMKVAPMSGRPLREKAQRWLEALVVDAPTERLAAENRAKDEKIALLEEQMADLKKALDKLTVQLTEKST